MAACPPGQLSLAFDRTNPEALRWAAERSATLITNVTREARDAVRSIMARAFSEGIPPREAAKLIRAVVGLTERDALAVMRAQLGMMEAGVPPERAQALAERYAGRLHRRRALTIARTETMAASNRGQEELWRQAVAAGHLPPNWLKEWLITRDEITCPVCRPMEGVTVPLSQSFAIDGPPAHPNCRCTVGLAEPSRAPTQADRDRAASRIRSMADEHGQVSVSALGVRPHEPSPVETLRSATFGQYEVAGRALTTTQPAVSAAKVEELVRSYPAWAGEPVTFYVSETGEHFIYDGHHRVAAALLLRVRVAAEVVYTRAVDNSSVGA